MSDPVLQLQVEVTAVNADGECWLAFIKQICQALRKFSKLTC